MNYKQTPRSGLSNGDMVYALRLRLGIRTNHKRVTRKAFDWLLADSNAITFAMNFSNSFCCGSPLCLFSSKKDAKNAQRQLKKLCGYRGDGKVYIGKVMNEAEVKLINWL